MNSEQTDRNLEKDQRRSEFRKIKKELEEKTKLAEDRLNNLKYLQADFDNYRKQFEKERENIVKLANEGLIKELLTVLDEFEISLNEIKDEKVKIGLELIYKNFLKVLEKNGLRKIDALGKNFDHNFHEVLLKEKNEKEGIILEELQKGYILKSKVIRPSKVKIGEKQDLENNIGGK